ncbi:hypothetical protein J3R30DRAFT_3701899 [Lentinula aciculospora]|uniref:F-box domain-containing protein n=1 Tax=Lentinula aciculospora TaxID=153920 RepID=A0A9W9ABI6_9AGAR|nr:hypothetical protein J3R30DRAFT_3701899 [Lentinula aciculospora]
MLNVDVVSLVCKQLEYGTYRALNRSFRSREDLDHRKGLLSLCLTSKVFLEPALNVLWRTLSSVEPLLSVLPETIDLNGKKMIVEQIAPSSWDRLRYYTSRVRTFADDGSTNYGLAPGSLIFFLTNSISDATLPLLVSLPSDIPRSRAFACPSCFWTLRLGRLPVYEPDLVKSLACLPKLSSLSLTLLSNGTVDYDGIQNGFPSLKHLSIEGSTADLHDFLNIISPSMLQELSLIWNAHPSITEAIGVTTLLPRLSTLRSLTIDDMTPFFPETFDQLSQLRELSYCSPLVLTDEITATIASSWSHIEILSFTAVMWSDVPLVSSLTHFARGCPNLRYLRYPIEVSVSPTGAAPPPTPFIHPLQDFVCSAQGDVSDPLSLTLGLHQIFPGLKSVNGDGDRWDEVQAILQSFHFIVAQNRHFI